MNKYLLILSVFLFTTAKAQTYSTELGRTGGRPIFYNAAPTPDGGYLLSGYSSTTSSDSSMALVAKVDSALNLKWCKRVRSYKKDDFYSITPLKNGGYWLGGTSREDIVTIKGASAIKVNENGDVLSGRLYSDSYDDRTMAIFENPDNSLMIFVRKGVSDEPTKMIKADPGANILSSYKLARGSNNLMANDVATDKQGQYYMVGTISTTGIEQGMYVTKLNANGPEWYKEYDLGRKIQGATGITWLTDGSLAVTGILRDSANSSYNFFAMKLDTAGNIIWKRELNAGQLGSSQSISAMEDGGMIISGAATVAQYVMMVRLTGDGNVVWSKRYTGLSGGYAIKVNELADGRLMVLGADIASPKTALLVLNANGEADCSNNLTLAATSPAVAVTSAALTTTVPAITGYLWEPDTISIALNQLAGCVDVTGIEDRFENAISVQVYPNPASGYFQYTIAEQLQNDTYLLLYDVAGKLVKQERITSPTGRMITTPFSSGLYFWQLITNEKIAARGKVVLE